MDLKKTLNLPDPEFTIPMKAELNKLEPKLQQEWDELNIYHFLRQTRAGNPKFVLHDGPPYTNSPIHLGTALNKILKDITMKSKCMMGYDCPYVPGFDNHGLPIEQSVQKNFENKSEKPSLEEFREACRKHAQKYIAVQSEQFKRLGVLADWKNPYATMDYAFEAGIIRTFSKLVELGYIYRGLRPVFWSPTSQTALADSEIIYQEHQSDSVFVKFPIQEDPHEFFKDYPSTACVIWTTTPWTIPANQAVAFHPEFIYAIVRCNNQHLILLESLVESVMQKIGITEWEQIGKIVGKSLEELKFKHPLFERVVPGVSADYVTTEDGTGCVHTAPGHGRDDFYTGLRYNLDILCPVDEKGIMTKEAGEFEGLHYTKCNSAVIQKLKESRMLLHYEKFLHSYPYAERDGKPVIFRATEQWFLSVDAGDLRQQMLDQIDEVRWIPKSGKARIEAMVKNRPDWCLSRQRPWGVGIPVLYGKQSGKPVLDPTVMEAIAVMTEQEGSTAWFAKDPYEILPEGYKHLDTEETEFIKEVDVFDVWFDAGCSHLNVLDTPVHPEWDPIWPADLYLEGSDQHRGWFNTSLVLGTAIRGQAPFKAVLTHGFIVDKNGYKMSKRLGNTIDPIEVCQKYGADVLRYWVASINYKEDVPCSEELLKQCGEGYRRIRNTLRFLLSNLYDYTPGMESKIHELDSWIIEQCNLLNKDVVEAYERFDFSEAVVSIHHFCTQQVSAFYADSIKDRIYCDGKEWPSRRSAQYTCYFLLQRLIKLVAPILVHTAEETYKKMPGLNKRATVHAELFDILDEETIDQIKENLLQKRFASMLETRAQVFSLFEKWKENSEIKDSQDVKLILHENSSVIENLKSFGDELPIYFKMSAVELYEGTPNIEFLRSEFEKCDRSRLRRSCVTETQGIKLTKRDRAVLQI